MLLIQQNNRPMADNNDNTPGQGRNSPEGHDARLDRTFNEFLHIRELDTALIRRYRDTLCENSGHFARLFHDYLLRFRDTATVIRKYQESGGLLDDLVKNQTRHLVRLLEGDSREGQAARLRHIGTLHYQWQVEPVWVMGAYLLYLNHLMDIVRRHEDIAEADREALEQAIVKLLFRDMGMLHEGTSDASFRALQREQEKLTAMQEHMTSLLDNIPQMLWSVDVATNQPLYVSPGAFRICEREPGMPIPCETWTVPEDQPAVLDAWSRAVAGERVEVESRVSTPAGEIRWFRRIFNPFSDSLGRVVRIDGLLEDATESRLTREQLRVMATTDSLTQLPNRAGFQGVLHQAVERARRDGRQVALMLMDLDHFKEINDSLGHPAGDYVLSAVGTRLRSRLRDSDVLARFGGDEFTILLRESNEARQGAERVAHQIVEALREPFHYQNQELYLGASIGIAIYPDHGEDADTLMSHADVAMYGGKRSEAGYLFYDEGRDPHRNHRPHLAGQMRRALADRQFELHYQPKVRLDTGEVVGAEALIRWHHPEYGQTPPEDFIPVAERSGFIRPITDWVLERAVSDCRRWADMGMTLPVAVNISARAFQDPRLVDRLEQLFDRHGVQQHCLEFEITEHVLMADIDIATEALQRISAMGIRIAVDDYGTGASSLAYLKRLPLDTLKIDRSFVMDMSHDDNDAVIVRSTIDLAHNLGRDVTAEGIENLETWNLLQMLGCDMAQGFFICPPLPDTGLLQWLNACGGRFRPQ